MLSVIVPVYNAEKYLEKCICSIINQSYTDLEIILVDDGSCDHSGEMCDAFARHDGRISVIHSVNEGVLSARRKGVLSSNGEAVAFVDSDDWIEEDMYQVLMDLYEKYKPDVISSGFFIEDRESIGVNDNIEVGIYTYEQVKEKILPRMMFDAKSGKCGVNPSVANKIFKRDLLVNCIESIEEGIALGEDARILYPLLAQAKVVYISGQIKYHYRKNESSMCNSCTVDEFYGVLKLKNELERVFKELDVWEVVKSQIGPYIGNEVSIVVNNVFGRCAEGRQYRMPYKLVRPGEKVVLYGAGVVGKAYWRELMTQKIGEVVEWIDKSSREIYGGINIKSPEVIGQKEYDCVVIAVLNVAIACEIKESLLAQGVEEHKIRWEKPLNCNLI